MRFWQEVQGLEFRISPLRSILVVTKFVLEKSILVRFLNFMKAFNSEQVYLSDICSPLVPVLGFLRLVGLLFLEFFPIVIMRFLWKMNEKCWHFRSESSSCKALVRLMHFSKFAIFTNLYFLLFLWLLLWRKRKKRLLS